MAWILLLIAGGLEVAWAVGLKASHGLSKPWIALATILAMLGSFVLLGMAVRTIPLGTGYAVWTGIGVLGTVILGILFFGESISPSRLFCLALILIGIIGLKATG